MNYLIIEDEEPASLRLDKMIKDISPDAICLGCLVSISSSVAWFQKNKHPDIVFMDIQLGDGESFEIFKMVDVNCPVVFTTAFDQYALKAFKVNSVDYLLKPIKKHELELTINKFESDREPEGLLAKKIDYKLLALEIRTQTEYQKRLLIRFGDTFKAVEINRVAYFYTKDRSNYLCTADGDRYPIDEKLDKLEIILNPGIFFRINRQFIVNINSIKRMVSYSKSRVKLEMDPPSDSEIIVSTDKSPGFKSWLKGSE
jgi:two-component system, LytTR family, response regulator